MGLRFRKVFSNGPLRATMGGKGLGCSFGVPGFRIGVAANGSLFITLGFPGSGLSYTKYLKFF